MGDFLGVPTQDDDASILFCLRVVGDHLVDGVDEEGDAFPLVSDTLGDEEDESFVKGEVTMRASFRLVGLPVETGVNGVGDGGDGFPREEWTSLRLFLEPFATGDEGYRVVSIGLLFPFPDTGGEVMRVAVVWQEWALSASREEVITSPGVMADACGRPKVVHRPDDGFSALDDFPECLE